MPERPDFLLILSSAPLYVGAHFVGVENAFSRARQDEWVYSLYTP